MNGRSVNEAKNNVWPYPAAIGSTGRSDYEMTLATKEVREIPADRVQEAANNERRVAEPEPTEEAAADAFNMAW